MQTLFIIILTLLLHSAVFAGCNNILVLENNSIACNSRGCGQYPVRHVSNGTQQVGCTDNRCHYYFVPTGFSLACWSDACNVFKDIQVSNGIQQVGCLSTLNSCRYRFVQQGFELVCTNQSCHSTLKYYNGINPHHYTVRACSR